MAFLAEMADEDGGEIGIAPRSEHREAVPGEPQQQPDEPLLETEADRGGDRAVDDRQPAGAPPSRIGDPRLVWIGTSNPSICAPLPITRPTPRRRS